MDLIVDVHVRPVCSPAHGRHGAADLKRRHGQPPALVTALPDLDGPVVRADRHELDARAAGQGGAIEVVDDAAMREDFVLSLATTAASGDIHHAECIGAALKVKSEK